MAKPAPGHVAKLVNAAVCKTAIRGFEPHRGLHPPSLLRQELWGILIWSGSSNQEGRWGT